MAVEGAPRQDRNTETTDSTNSDTEVRESFIESWQRRLRDRVAESSLGGWLTEQEDDEAEKEDADKTEVSPAKNRFKRLRGSLRGMLVPKPDQIEPESEPEAWTPVAASTGGEVNVDSPNLNETRPSELDAEIIDVPDTSVRGTEKPIIEIPEETETAVIEIPEVAENHESEPTDTEFVPLETEGTILLEPSTSETTPRPEPESLQTILERQHNIRPINTESVAVGNSSGESVTSVTVNNYEKGNDTGALLAVDLLNYGVARRRDTKKEKASIARDEKIKKEASLREKEINQRIEQQKLYQEELQKRTVKLEKQQPDRLPRIRQADWRGPAQEAATINPVIVDRNTSIRTAAEISNKLEAKSAYYESMLTQPEQKIVATPDIALPSVERVMSKVEKAAEFNIPIETEYELRHERKGNTDYSFDEGSQGPMAPNGLEPGYSDQASRLATARSSTSKQPDNDKVTDNNYSQAVATGAWGAVVGIILFVIYIILT